MTKMDVCKIINSKCNGENALTESELDYFISINPDLVREILSLDDYSILELAIKTSYAVHDHNQFLPIYCNALKGTKLESILLLSGPMLFCSQNKEQDFDYIADVINKTVEEEKAKVKVK